MEEEYSILNKKFGNLGCLFVEFTVSDDADEEISKFYAKDNAPQAIINTLAEGEEVLVMEPFPQEWIGDMLNIICLDIEWRKTWLKKVLKMVEEEAIQIGKLPADFAIKSR